MCRIVDSEGGRNASFPYLVFSVGLVGDSRLVFPDEVFRLGGRGDRLSSRFKPIYAVILPSIECGEQMEKYQLLRSSRSIELGETG